MGRYPGGRERLNRHPRTGHHLRFSHLYRPGAGKTIKKIDTSKKIVKNILLKANAEQRKIMSELKHVNKFMGIDKPYRLALLESNIPSKLKASAMQKINMLRSMDSCDPEYFKVKNWVDNFMRIPFCKYTSLSVSMADGIEACHEFMSNAKSILDKCVYGLDDAKLQILQMVGQWIANPNAMGTAIAIKGPPGTGKTTLVKDGISKILGREFIFIPLGGAGDASYLEGHSYTYEGSVWGKIVQSLMDCGSMNPVFYFDELDKLSETPKGEEIAGILTHLTDTSQNSQFHDKYFSDVDFDLSKCLFIFSYNDENKVNPILRDRMYRIMTQGYDAKEKTVIARDYMLPKIREQVNFKPDEIIIPDETVKYIVSTKHLTQDEAGVRNMKRCLEIIHTKLNLFRLMRPDENLFSNDIKIDVKFPITITQKEVDALIKNEEKQSQSLLAMYI
jgi:ATP-dependent Lon protease